MVEAREGTVSPLRRWVRAARAAFARSAIGRARTRKRLLAELRSFGPHDHEMARFYGQFLRAGDVCFDVGANVGNRTKIFRHLGATVVAVEPQPACLELLREVWGADAAVRIVPSALGAAPGQAEMRVSDASTLSSLSPEWIEKVRASGRFREYRWDRVVTVPLTTLDALVEAHGVPAFLKIDVEGFEQEVLAGLHRPVRTLSFEFTPECLGTALACVAHLASLGPLRFNYSSGESMQLSFDAWLDRAGIEAFLESQRDDVRTFGDVYARFGAETV